MEPIAAEQILVCLSPSPSNEKVILAAEKMARAYHAELTALYVEQAGGAKLSPADQAQLERNIALAKRCGAHVATTCGRAIAGQIALYAATAQVKKIVLGRPRVAGLRVLRGGDVVQQLTQLMPELEIYLIPDGQTRSAGQSVRVRERFSLRSALMTAGLLAAATLLGLLLQRRHFTDANIITVYLLSVLFTAYWTQGPAYGIASSLLSVLIFNFLFTEPRFTFQAYESGYPLTFFVMLVAAMLTSSLTTKVRTQARINAQKAYRTEVLLTASRNLQDSEEDDEIISETARQLHKLLGKPVLITPVVDGALRQPLLVSDDEAPPDPGCLETMEKLLARQPRPAEQSEPYQDAVGFYLPLVVHRKVRAMVVVLTGPGGRIGEFERSLMLALLGECGMALEKHRLWQAKQSLAMSAEQEKLRANLLRSISHDLRTPLTSISGNAEMLMSGRLPFTDAQRQALYESIYDDSTWLISLVENLLSITRMDDSALRLTLRPELVADVVDEAVTHMRRRARANRIVVQIEDELLFARMDAPLILQVLVNLLDNAVKYTQEDSTITISARREDALVWISVADDGPGISPEAQKQVFEMFYTGGNLRFDGRRGLGLGLALCRAIVTAHGGRLTVENAAPHGAVFSFSLIGEETEAHD